MDVTLEKADMKDAAQLVEIQRRAFERLYNIYGDENSPYLRGTEEFRRWLEHGCRPYKIHADGRLAGGVTVFKREDGEYYLARIFILPELQKNGIAKRAIALCEKSCPDAKRWTLDYPEDQTANRRCYESCGYVDTGSRRVINDRLTLVDAEKIIRGIFPLREAQLPAALDVIHKSFSGVAEKFGLTRENFPEHIGFMTAAQLQEQVNCGFYMFGLYESGKMIGFEALSKESNEDFVLRNIAVLPEYRRRGYGRLLIDHAKEKVRLESGHKITVGITKENAELKKWYEAVGFVHTGTEKIEGLPFASEFIQWENEL